MSLRLEMLQVARLAPNELREASGQVVEYLQGQFNPDGGVRDRDGNSDLYYTVFGLDALAALTPLASRHATVPAVDPRSYLESFGTGDDLDLVHVACLARCWTSVEAGGVNGTTRTGLLANLGRFRSADGGFAPQPGAERGTVYHCFLAYGAYQDLQAEVPAPAGLVDCVEALRTPDGAYANERGLGLGTTPATAAAVTLLRNLDAAVPGAAGEWLMQQVAPDGGFLAMPRAPIPDLLSTATALHALSGLQLPLDAVGSACLDFVDTLWTGQAFCGNWADDCPDVEYTFYGLLALGHLSL